jgi:hypothetical protein
MPGKKIIFVAILCIICLLNSPLWALEIKTVLQPDTIGLNETAILKIFITGAESVEPLAIPSVGNIELEYTGGMQGTNIINFDVTHYYVLQYRIIPTKQGVFMVPALTFNADGKKYISKPVQLTVTKKVKRRNGSGARDPFQLRSRLRDAFEEPAQEVDITVEAESDFSKKHYYPGQPIVVRYFLLSDKIESLDIKGFESFPELKGFIRNDIEENIPDEPITRRGKILTKKYLMTLVLLPTSPGIFEIGGGRLLAVLSSGNFFSFGRKKYVTFTPQKVRVIPLPQQGKPPKYSGNVGDFSILLEKRKYQSEKYQEIVVEVIIKGEGNFNTLSAPDFEHTSDNFKVIKSEGDFKREKADFPNKGQKIFTFTLIPEEKGDFSLGRIVFNFFNPSTGKYGHISTDEIIVAVNSAGEGATSIAFDNAPDRGSKNMFVFILVLSGMLLFSLLIIVAIVIRWERKKYATLIHGSQEHKGSTNSTSSEEVEIDQDGIDELFKKQLLYSLHKGRNNEYLNIADKIIAYLINEKLVDREDKKAALYSLQHELLQYRYGGGEISDQLIEKVKSILLQYL